MPVRVRVREWTLLSLARRVDRRAGLGVGGESFPGGVLQDARAICTRTDGMKDDVPEFISSLLSSASAGYAIPS